jgi:hypothetical protein
MSKAKLVRLSTGLEVPLDGDLLAIIEALYKEVTLGNALNSTFETMRSEILALIDQMDATDRRMYLAESLFLNSVTYENEMLAAYVRRLGTKEANAPSSTDAKAGKQKTAKVAPKKKVQKKKAR